MNLSHFHQLLGNASESFVPDACLLCN